MASNPNWESFSIQLPGQDLLEKARQVLETLVVYLEVLKTILETVKAFLVDFGNPIRAIVEALIQLVLQLFETLRRTGIYAWYDIPDPFHDPNFTKCAGGYEEFLNRFTGGLFDPRDPNRPQPIPGISMGGFTLIVADADGILGLLRLVKILLDFLGKDFLTPQYLAPASIKVLPVGDAGDPILSIVKVFQEQPKSIVVEWTLPPSSVVGADEFSDLFGAIATNFIPPNFLIEKSEVHPLVSEIDVAEMTNADSAGIIVATLPTPFEARGKPGNIIKRKTRINDQYGDTFIKFQKYIVVSTTSNTATFLLGQLGTFRYIDNDVELDKTYYYRVRAFSGNLDISGTTLNFMGQVQFKENEKIPYIQWPGDNVMGRATSAVPVRIPTYPPDFDVIESLNRLFQTAFSLNFHLPPNEWIDEDTSIGKGSLTSFAGPLTAFESVPLVGKYAAVLTPSGSAPLPTEAYMPNFQGEYPELPWNNLLVQSNSARLASIVASAMLQSGGAFPYKTFMEGPFPQGVPSVKDLDTSNLNAMVFSITNVQDVDESTWQITVQDAGVLYSNVYDDSTVRKNVLAAVNFCKAFTLGGTPPDWIQVSLLRDIIPWGGQLLYELLAKMQALLDAYSGVIEELKAFIDLIIRKIDTLEQFLQYLISILDFVLSLQVGFYILTVPKTSGDTTEWVTLIQNAGGSPPPSGAGGYTAGVALAYVAPNVDAFASAFDLIF